MLQLNQLHGYDHQIRINFYLQALIRMGKFAFGISTSLSKSKILKMHYAIIVLSKLFLAGRTETYKVFS